LRIATSSTARRFLYQGVDLMAPGKV
jgi:hypothetical protein